MSIVGHGIDVVDIRAFGEMLTDPEGDFSLRCFTQRERNQYVDTASQSGHLAGIFAAKEAVVKALGTGFNETVSPLDIEIIRDGTGAPKVCLTGDTAGVATSLRISAWHVSISHTAGTAMASVIAVNTHPNAV